MASLPPVTSGSSIRTSSSSKSILAAALAAAAANNAATANGASSSRNATASLISSRSAAAAAMDDDAIYRIDRDVLLSIAASTPLDLGLSHMVQQRPMVAELLADQTVWLVATIEKLRRLARIPKHARPTAVDDYDAMPTVTASAVHQPSVVLIGCGFVGGRVAERLLETKVIHPSSLHIMTRQPETLTRFAKAGVLCGTLKPNDAATASSIASADVVIIAVLPGQLSAVSRCMKDNLRSSAIAITLCAGVVVEKVCSECQHPLCIAADVDTAGAATIADSLGETVNSANLRRVCEEQLLACVLPLDNLSSAPATVNPNGDETLMIEDGVDDHGALPIASSSTFNGVSGGGLSLRSAEWLSRVAFVLASAGTAMGLPFHYATFAAWGFMCCEEVRVARFKGAYKDHVCPGPSDAHRMAFSHLVTFCDMVGLSTSSLSTNNSSRGGDGHAPADEDGCAVMVEAVRTKMARMLRTVTK